LVCREKPGRARDHIPFGDPCERCLAPRSIPNAQGLRPNAATDESCELCLLVFRGGPTPPLSRLVSRQAICLWGFRFAKARGTSQTPVPGIWGPDVKCESGVVVQARPAGQRPALQIGVWPFSPLFMAVRAPNSKAGRVFFLFSGCFPKWVSGVPPKWWSSYPGKPVLQGPAFAKNLPGTVSETARSQGAATNWGKRPS